MSNRVDFVTIACIMNKFTIIVIGLLIGLVGLIYLAASNKKANTVPIDLGEIAQIQEGDNVLGNSDADVVLFKYTDFECPACKAYDPVVKDLMEQYSDRVAFVPRHFPLYFHQNAKPAAWAAEAAGKQGKYFEMSQAIFAGQADWAGKVANVSLFYPYAEELGLDMEQFRVDATSDEVKAKTDKDFRTGTTLAVNSTPTFYINSTKIARNPGSIEEFASLLDQALEQTAALQNETAATTTEIEVATSTEG